MKTQEQKRVEAEARQAVYDALTPLVKLDIAATRPGESRRERDRIWKQIRQGVK